MVFWSRLPIYFFPTTTTEDADKNITFNASGTYDVEGDNVTYYWDFGDDMNGTGQVVIHSGEGRTVIKIFHLFPGWAYSARNYISHYF